MAMENPKDIEAFLVELCELARHETMPHFRTRLDVSNKDDSGFDPVTLADRNAERVIRERISERFPDHAIIGEEYGSDNGNTSPYQWIIDPVDGTRAFISGLPLWGTLIGFYKDRSPVAGIMSQPFTGETFLSNSMESILLHGARRKELATSHVTSLGEATLMTTSPFLFAEEDRSAYQRVEEQCKLARYGADCYAYCMLAAGNIDLVIEGGLNIYDIAALVPIIRDAGGIVTDWQGNPDPWGGNVIAAANSDLHAQAIHFLDT